jgi:hypothetical protein
MAIGFATFSAMALGSVALVRAQFGAAAPHYALFATPGMVAMTLLLWRWAEDAQNAWRSLVIAVMTTMLAVALVGAYQWGLAFGPTWRQFWQINAYLVREYQFEDASVFKRILPKDPAIVVNFAPVLEEHGWSPFDEVQEPPAVTLPAPQHPVDMRIELINNEPAPGSAAGSGSVLVDPTAHQSIEIQGWAADPVAGPIRALFVVIDGTTRLPAKYGLDRPDIAALAPHGSRDRFVGFYAAFATSLLGPGRHEITFVAVPAEGASYAIVPEVPLAIQI